MINKEPVYIQINKAIRKLIIDEKYSVGDKFLTERTICEKFDVSRSTANKSLSSLVSENVLEFKKGIGTFIKSIPDTDRAFSQFRDPLELLKENKIMYTLENISLDSSFYSDLPEVKIVEIIVRRIKTSRGTLAVELIFLTMTNVKIMNELKNDASISSMLHKGIFSDITETVDSVSTMISTERDVTLFESDYEISLMKITSDFYSNKQAILRTVTLYNGEMISIEFVSQKKKISLSLL